MHEDPRTPEQIAADLAIADQYAPKGTLQHFLLRMGFMPNDEQEAEAILCRIIRENDQMHTQREP